MAKILDTARPRVFAVESSNPLPLFVADGCSQYQHVRTHRRSARREGLITAGAAGQGAAGAEAERDARRLQPRQARLHSGNRAHEDAGQAAQDAGRRSVAIRGGSEDREDDPERSRAEESRACRSSATAARSPSRWPIRRTSACSRISSSSRATTSSRCIAGEFTLRGLIEKVFGATDEAQMASLMDTINELEAEAAATSKSSRRRRRTSRRRRCRRRWKTRRSSS